MDDSGWKTDFSNPLSRRKLTLLEEVYLSHCATIIGLLCLAGPPVPLDKTFSMWSNEQATWAGYKLNHRVLDAHYLVSSSSLTRACKRDTCVRFALRADTCVINFNIYLDDGRSQYDGADEYELTLKDSSDLLHSLSRVYVTKTVMDDDSGLALADIPSFNDVKLDCNGR